MTNEQRQKSCDKLKWNESIEKQRDMSGEMDYCAYCSGSNNCTYSQEEKESKTICATAYNKMKRVTRRNI